FRVRSAFVITVYVSGVVTRSNAHPAYAKGHLVRMEQFLQQSFALRFRHLMNHVASRISKCRPKTEYGLPIASSSKHDRIFAGRPVGIVPDQRLGRGVALVAGCETYGHGPTWRLLG